MKTLLLVLAILLMPRLCLTRDLQINISPIEIGDSLPFPYECISYRGHSSEVAALILIGCIDKGDGWVYPKVYSTDFFFEWYGEKLFLRMFGTGGKNQVNLYRRTP